MFQRTQSFPARKTTKEWQPFFNLWFGRVLGCFHGQRIVLYCSVKLSLCLTIFKR